MRKQDKLKNMKRVNLLIEQRFRESRTLNQDGINENTEVVEGWFSKDLSPEEEKVKEMNATFPMSMGNKTIKQAVSRLSIEQMDELIMKKKTMDGVVKLSYYKGVVAVYKPKLGGGNPHNE